MLRLLFSTVAIVPIAIIPWMTSEAETLPFEASGETYQEQILDPNLQALSDCREGELPIFFHDTLVTMHTAEYIEKAIKITQACDEAEVTIIPVLPEYADASDIGQSVLRTAELAEFIDVAANMTNLDVEIDIASDPVEEDNSTLYVNGRAAILRIQPDKA